MYLEGTVKSIEAGDLLLLAPKGSFSGAVVVQVQAVNNLKDSAGNPYTEVVPAAPPGVPAADAPGYQLLHSTASFGLWKYSTPSIPDLFDSPMDTEAVERYVNAGQVLVATLPGSSPAILSVDSTVESIWYTNGDAFNPPPAPTAPGAAPHTRIYWTAGIDATPFNDNAAAVKILADWRSVGTLRNVPVTSFSGKSTLLAQGGATFRVGAQQKVLIEDVDGNGVLATVSVDAATPGVLTIASFDVNPPPTLKTPIRVLQDVIQLTRGKTVDPEQLGFGDGTVMNQEFVLKKSPLTYFPAGDSYKSSLTVYVNGVQWAEVANFYGQPANAPDLRRCKHQQKTHIKFGDGVNGRLRAEWRAHSGAIPHRERSRCARRGSLNVITKPFPGLRAVRYPVAGGGGADPDPSSQIRKYAPKSVLTFGRAISADDYEAIAAGAPSVQRVRAYYAWNPEEQRATVTLYVGNTPAAVDSAKNALRASADPDRPVSVLSATAVYAALFIAIRVQPGRILEDVKAAVRTTLADSETGLFGVNRTGIGETIYFSQMSDRCQSVPGVDAVSGAIFLMSRPDPQTGLFWGIPPRLNAGPGEYFAIPPEWVVIFPEVLTSV